jgi:hypothetical protein
MSLSIRTIRRRALRRRLGSPTGQALVEFSLAAPFLVMLVLAVCEFGYLLLDEHIVTRLAREGSNLISRDTSLSDAASAMQTMSTRPVDFGSGATVIFSVLKRGATTGTPNYNQLILYQRHQAGALSASSSLRTAGGGSFSGAPNYEAANSDSNTGLRVTNAPTDLIAVPGGLIYVTEIFSTHELITPLDRFGLQLPQRLYSIAYF